MYAGEVFPLYVGNRIDVDDVPYPKYDCMRFASTAHTIPYATPKSAATAEQSVGRGTLLKKSDWHVESNKFGNYLVFDASELAAQRIVNAIAADPVLGVRRWDASHRAADNGRYYDWFVRLIFDGDRDVCVSRLAGILDRSSLSEPRADPTLDLSAIPEDQRDKILDALTRALSVVRDNERMMGELEESREEVARLNGQLDQLARESEELRGSAKESTELLQLSQHESQRLRAQLAERTARHRDVVARTRAKHEKELGRLRSEPRAHQDSNQVAAAQEGAISALQAELSELLREKEKLEGESAEWMLSYEQADLARGKAEEALRELASRNDALESRNATFALELDELSRAPQERQRRALSAAVSGTRPSLSAFLDKVFRRLELEGESVDTMLTFERLDRTFDYLAKIDRNEPVDCKKVQGYPGWFEITHVNTGRSGRSDRGRIYYRPDNDSVRTLVHLKQDDTEQQRFMRANLR